MAKKESREFVLDPFLATSWSSEVEIARRGYFRKASTDVMSKDSILQEEGSYYFFHKMSNLFRLDCSLGCNLLKQLLRGNIGHNYFEELQLSTSPSSTLQILATDSVYVSQYEVCESLQFLHNLTLSLELHNLDIALCFATRI